MFVRKDKISFVLRKNIYYIYTWKKTLTKNSSQSLFTKKMQEKDETLEMDKFVRMKSPGTEPI